MLQDFTRWATAYKGLALGLVLAGATALPAAAQTAYGLATIGNGTGSTTLNLITFNVAIPGTFTATVPITGVATGQTLVGLDTRPATGELFALGYNNTTTQAQLYTLNRTTGAVTAVGTALTLNLSATNFRIGFDFNPTVDRIRVTSSAGTNYRLNPNNGALVATDGTLAYATTDANAGQTPQVGSSAYTNSYIGSTATTLYNIDEGANRLVTQVPPNDGTLNTVGPLGISLGTGVADLDIYFNPSTNTNVAYMTAAAYVGAGQASSTLLTLNLSTGAATSVGLLGNSAANSVIYVSDIALAIDRTVPATVTGQLAYALAGTNLLTFDTALPGTIRTSVGITGVDATQTLVGLDVRPANNGLYALGYNANAAAGVANSQLYSINAVTGVATAISGAVRLELGTGAIGFDFNPTVDRIRVVGANRNNYRLNPTFGVATALAATDGVVAYTTGTATPTIGTVAYTNSYTGPTPATTTTLYNYDLALNQLNTQATANPPADGQLTAVGTSGLVVNATAPAVDLDIYSTAAGVNTAYLVANTGTSANTSLYTVNLTSGAATLVGAIGNGIAARNIAVAVATGVVTGTRATELASDLSLSPNPLANSARLSFNLTKATHVELTVTDALGRTVEHVDAGQLAAGTQSVSWHRKSQRAGVYFFRLSFDGQPAGTRQGVLTE